MKVLTFIWLILIYCNVKAQNHFIKIIDFDSLSQSSQQIIKQGDDYLLGYYQTCKSDLESQCSGVIRMNEFGNIKDKVWLEKFSNNPNSILLADNKLLLTGEEYNFQTDAHEFLINELEKETLDSIITIPVLSKEKPLVKMFQLSNAFWNDKYVIAGNGRVIENSYNRGTVYILNKDYSLDTLLYFDFANKNFAIWNVFVDYKNMLNVCMQYQNDGEDYTSIMKFDTNYNMVWQWISPEQRAAKALPHGFEDNSNNIIINLDDLEWTAINNVYCVRPDSTIKWILKWPGDLGGQSRFIDRLRPAKNGDIIGVGRYGNLINNPRLERVPFIFRIHPNGNFKWIKVYYKDQKYTSGSLVEGGFSDVIEADNGDLIAVGRIHNVLDYDPKVEGPRNDWDIIVARLGADGCIESGCEDINKIDVKVGIENVKMNDKLVTIYPNPFTDIANIYCDEKIEKINVYNSVGELLVTKNSSKKIDLINYPSGIYFLNLIIGNKSVLKKVIKI
jgi:hypothetical protein